MKHELWPMVGERRMPGTVICGDCDGTGTCGEGDAAFQCEACEDYGDVIDYDVEMMEAGHA